MSATATPPALTPEVIDAVARELHELLCGGGPLFAVLHGNGDHTKARFLLLGLQARGYELRARDGAA